MNQNFWSSGDKGAQNGYTIKERVGKRYMEASEQKGHVLELLHYSQLLVCFLNRKVFRNYRKWHIYLSPLSLVKLREGKDYRQGRILYREKYEKKNPVHFIWKHCRNLRSLFYKLFKTIWKHNRWKMKCDKWRKRIS